MLENFFRRWYLYLIPVVVLGALGLMSVSGSKSKFQSIGTFNVESTTVLSSLSGGTDPGFGYDTPADATSKRINATLGTDQFIKDVLNRSGYTESLPVGMSLGQVRSSISAFSNGANLVNVAATTTDPNLSQKLAASTIAAFVQSVVDSNASQSTAAIKFFDDLLTTYQGNIDSANKALNDYMTAHPVSSLGVRSADEQAEITRLTAAVTAAQSQYDGATAKRQDAQLQAEQTKADVGERMRLVDPPQVPALPLSGMKAKVQGLATFIFLGVLLMVGAVVLGTLVDHSIQTANDVKEKLGVRVLGVVPDGASRRNARRAARTAKAKTADAAKKQKVAAKADKQAAPAAGKRRAAPVQPISARTGPAAGAGRRTGRPAGRPVSKASGGSGWPG
jgi:capsular polysaccharide biosynthesis protein